MLETLLFWEAREEVVGMRRSDWWVLLMDLGQELERLAVSRRVVERLPREALLLGSAESQRVWAGVIGSAHQPSPPRPLAPVPLRGGRLVWEALPFPRRA